MKIKGVVPEDFINYKLPAMFINTSTCSFKCDKECGMQVCQNSSLANSPTIDVDDEWLVASYIDNPITKAIVIGGLEPFDTMTDLSCFIIILNLYHVSDDLVIYTGYNENEITKLVDYLKFLCAGCRDLIIKYGRYIPNDCSKYDDILGVTLASSNQYSKLYPKYYRKEIP